MTETPSLALDAVLPKPPDAKLEKAIADARRVLRSNGLSAIGERAKDALAAPPRKPTLVVIGEVKRGKSSLVNALLGRRNVSPVNVDIATSAFIRFVPNSVGAAEGQTTLLFAGDRRRRIHHSDLPNWVTVSGSQVQDAHVDELPIGAEVVMTGPFLPHVVVVDTPGVGGLNPTHIRLATDAATRASALLMTCDASAPITAPEMAFLQSVSAEVDSVVIAVTKIDKNLRHWRSIVDENRRLLREHAPRFTHVPIVGVSSLRAAAALELEPGERRDTALRASGLPELSGHLDRMCDAEDRLVVVNALRIARSGLERVGDQLALQRSAIEGGTVMAQELTAERERLQGLKDEQKGGWKDFLNRDLNTVQFNSTLLLDEKLDELKTRWRTSLDAAKLEVIRRSPQLFVADMTADLEVLVGQISDDYVAAVTKLVSGLGADIDVSMNNLSGMRIPDAKAERPSLLDPQLLTLGVIGGSTLGGPVLAALGVTAGAAFWPVTFAIGGAWVAVNLAYRAVKSGRQNLQQWLTTTAGAVRNDIVRDLQERTNTIRPIIYDEYRRHLAQSIAQLQQLINEANTAARNSLAEREDALSEIKAKEKDHLLAMASVDAQLTRYSATVS